MLFKTPRLDNGSVNSEDCSYGNGENRRTSKSNDKVEGDEHQSFHIV